MVALGNAMSGCLRFWHCKHTVRSRRVTARCSRSMVFICLPANENAELHLQSQANMNSLDAMPREMALHLRDVLKCVPAQHLNYWLLSAYDVFRGRGHRAVESNGGRFQCLRPWVCYCLRMSVANAEMPCAIVCHGEVGRCRSATKVLEERVAGPPSPGSIVKM